MAEASEATRQSRLIREVTDFFAREMARFGGKAEDYEDLRNQIAAVAALPADVRAKLRHAGPGREWDIGTNLNHFVREGVTDAEREHLALVWKLHEQSKHLPRTEPITFAKMTDDAKALLNVRTPEELVTVMKRTGIRDYADITALRMVARTFEQEQADAFERAHALTIEQAEARRLGENRRADQLEAEITRQKEMAAMASMRKIAALETLTAGKGGSTSAARVLASLRMMIHPLTPQETFDSRFLGAMRAARIPKEKAEEFLTMIKDTMAQGQLADWERLTSAYREAIKPKMFDKFLEFWKAGLLGIPTQVANIGSNAMFFGLRNVENAVASLVKGLVPGMGGRAGQRFIGETSAATHGFKLGFEEAIGSLKAELSDIANLRSPNIARRMEMGTFFDEPDVRQLYGAIEGKKGEFVRIPFKLLDAFDNFFKHIIRNQEWGREAHRLASISSNRIAGESVQHATGRIMSEIRRAAMDPLGNHGLYMKKYGTRTMKDVIRQGTDTARSDTFQQPLNDMMHKIYQTTQSHPALQFLFPFVKTPYNILAEGMKRTPAGMAWAITQYKKTGDRGEFVENMVKSGLGSVAMLYFANAALEGTITGSGPVDPKEKEHLIRTGWKPYSFKIGKEYHSYQRFEPFATMLGLSADMAEAWKRKDMETGSEKMERAVAAFSKNIVNKSFMTGFSATTDILSDPDRKGLARLKQLQASLVPNIVGVVPVGQLARAMDPYYRETKAGTLSPFISNIPGLSQTLEPQYSPSGEMRRRPGTPLERLLLPTSSSEVRTDAIARASEELVRLGKSLESPPLFFRVGNDKVYYTPGERKQIGLAQEAAMKKLGNIVRSPEYRLLPDDRTVDMPEGARTKRSVIDSLVGRYRNRVVERARQQALLRARREG